ncbi:adenylate/guanylate cyclase domain-containing protein [Mesorhizobium sp. PL10]
MNTDKRTERRLAAILAADVADYSRLMRADEIGTFRLLTARREVMDSLIGEHGGSIANTAGDSVLAAFPSAVDAVQCAAAVQRLLATENRELPEGKRMEFRIGIHVGDVFIRGADLLGDGVNVAARLEGLSLPGGVCLSAMAYEHVRNSVPFAFEDLGSKQVKNIEEPLRVYALRLADVSLKNPSRVEKAPPLPDKPSLAILPFANQSGDPAQDYFVDGVVEDLVRALSRLRWLFVIATSSSFTYRDRKIELNQVGRELGVRYVLEGSLRRAGEQIRLSCQLIEAVTGILIWSDRFDGSVADIFNLQDRLTESIARAVEPKLRLAEITRARTKPTSDLTAYDLYLRAVAELNEHSAASFERGEALLRQAIDRDPDYAEAIALLATSIGHSGLNGWKPLTEAMAQALELSRRAARLDNASAEALATGAFAEALFGGSFERSEELAAAALQLNPNSIFVLKNCGSALGYGGETHRAIELFEAARRINPIDPRSFQTMGGLASAHFFNREFETAAYWARRVLSEHPHYHIARRYLAAALAHLGRLDEAGMVIAELLEAHPGSSLSRSRRSTFRHSWMLDLYVDGLRKAGLPE